MPAAQSASKLVSNQLIEKEKYGFCRAALHREFFASATPAVAEATPVAVRASRLSPNAAFYLQASITVSFLAGSSAPTPLYPLYQAEWGFSPTTVTVVFGIYAIAVLAALLVAGRLSDFVGRRPVLFVATVVQALTMLIFAMADGVSGLLVARIIQGLSAGAAVAAVGAGLMDIDKARGTVANAITTPLGTASGALAAGLMVQFLPAPTQFIYLVLGVIFVLQAIGIVFMPESISPRSGALASLKPQFALPHATRRPFLFAAPALIAAWALAGFYASLGPSLVRSLVESGSALLGGLALFALAGSAGVAVLLLQRHAPRTLMVYGTSALFAGMAIVISAVSFHSLTAFFVGTAITGAGFGASFQGAVRTVVTLAAPQERAGVLSLVFVVSYLAMGVPAVVAGYLVAQGGSIFMIAEGFCTGVMVLAGAALLGTLTSHADRAGL